MNKLYQRSFLRLMDFTYDEIEILLKLSFKLKTQKKKQIEKPQLMGKNIVLIFENNSTRTRCSFEVAAFDQGAHTTCLHPNLTQMGHKESIKDTAKVLGKLYNGIQYRGYSQKVLQTFSKYSGIPVWNGLTSEFHPTQILADLMTMQEHLSNKHFNQMQLAYVGDIRNNIGSSLLEAAAVTGLNLRLISPNIFWPQKDFFLQCQTLAQNKHGNVILTENINEGVKNVDFLYTDVWVSMGENEKVWEKRITLLKNYQVNMSMIHQTNNPNVKFLHCLPALHDNTTTIGKKIAEKYKLKNGLEVTNEIFESNYSVVFDQAENRLHTIKAIMLATLLPNYHTFKNQNKIL